MSTPLPDLIVDTTGKFCPVPIIETAKAIKAMEKGQTVLVLSTDPGVKSDMPAWCKATHHELLELTQDGKTFRALVRKAGK